MSNLKVGFLLEMVDRVTSPVRKMTRSFKTSLNQMSKSTRKLGKDVNDIGKGMTTKLSLPIIGLGGFAVKTAADFEKYKATLKTVTGTQEAASKAFESLLGFASKTPFQLDQSVQGFIKLKSRGLDPSITSLTSYGNTASAMGKSLDQMIEAVADASTGEFERLKEFGITAKSQGNKVAFTFQGVTKVVKKNSEEIQGYLQKIGDVNFAGAMTEQMNTMHGVFSNFQDVVTKSLNKVGNSITKNLSIKKNFTDFATQIERVTNWFIALNPSIQKFIIWTALFIAILGPALMVLGQFAIGLGWTIKGLILLKPLLIAVSWIGRSALIPMLIGLATTIKALGLALLTTPVGWFILAISAIAGAGYLVWKNWAKFKAFFLNMWIQIKSVVKSAIDSMMPIIDKFMNAVNSVVDGVGRVKEFVFGGDDTVSRYAPAIDIGSGIGSVNSVDTGGTLHIKIDQENQVRVVNAQTNDSRYNLNIDTGLIMGGGGF